MNKTDLRMRLALYGKVLQVANILLINQHIKEKKSPNEKLTFRKKKNELELWLNSKDTQKSYIF